MTDTLAAITLDEWCMILQSLDYTKRAFEEYRYPTYEFKQQRIAEVDQVRAKVRAIKKAIKAGAA